MLTSSQVWKARWSDLQMNEMSHSPNLPTGYRPAKESSYLGIWPLSFVRASLLPIWPAGHRHAFAQHSLEARQTWGRWEPWFQEKRKREREREKKNIHHRRPQTIRKTIKRETRNKKGELAHSHPSWETKKRSFATQHQVPALYLFVPVV